MPRLEHNNSGNKRRLKMKMKLTPPKLAAHQLAKIDKAEGTETIMAKTQVNPVIQKEKL